MATSSTHRGAGSLASDIVVDKVDVPRESFEGPEIVASGPLAELLGSSTSPLDSAGKATVAETLPVPASPSTALSPPGLVHSPATGSLPSAVGPTAVSPARHGSGARFPSEKG